MGKNVPIIRFPGFTDDWEQRKLSDEFSDFIVPMRDKPKEFGGIVPWTRIEDIEGKYLNGTLSGQYVTEETIKKMNLKIIPKDSLIVSSSATFGVVAIVTQDLITNQTFIGLVPKDKNIIDFWYSYFQSDEARRYMKLQSAGSTIFYISRESFEKMPITVPSKDEAVKIGEFFSNLDNTITLHQRKLEAIKEYKNGCLQKMFSRNGAAIPEMRFPEFTGDWEQRKLGDLVSLRGRIGFRGYKQTDLVEPGSGAITFSPADIDDEGRVSLINNKYLSWEKYEESPEIKVQPGDILFTKTASIGKIGYVKELKEKATINPQFALLTPVEEVAGYFIFNSVRTDEFMKKVRDITGGSSVPTMSQEKLKELTIMVPSLAEQVRIGEFLTKLDDTITLHQRRLDKYKELKKGLLQQMFV